MRLYYTLTMYLILPVALIRIFWRSRRAPAYRERWQERLGIVPKPDRQGGIWIHAVSVGEVQAIAPLVQHLLQKKHVPPICITTTTPTGSAQVRKLFDERVFNTYLPYDVPICLAGFLNTVKPVKLIMVETEVWPNLLYACQQRGIRTILANARMSEKSKRGYMRIRCFSQKVFDRIEQVAAQTDIDAHRLVQLGVRQSAIKITGNIKFDIKLPASALEQAEAMRLQWQNRPVWIAGSTHEGEDEIMLEAHRLLLEKLPDALLILVPRHPERFNSVANSIKKRNFDFIRRSTNQAVTPTSQVYLGDTMGELTMLLGASQVAFIGGSLVETGGHNMLEAAAQGVPTCFGPHTFNFSSISQQLIESQAAWRVYDAESLAGLLYAWLANANLRTQAGEAGRQLVDRSRGALQQLIEMV